METTADDLFAGAGGWSLAARRLGIRDRGVELMPAARGTRDAAGFETIHGDVWSFVPDGTAAGLIASPPCPPFSKARPKSDGGRALASVLDAVTVGAYKRLEDLRTFRVADDDDRTRLALTPLHYALTEPYRWLAWEQVPGALPLWEVCADVLRAAGWSVWTGVLDSEQYGTPQARRRAVLIASLDVLAAPPIPTHSKYHRHDPTRLDPGVRPWVSMGQALHDAGFPGWQDVPQRLAAASWCWRRPATTIVGSFRPDIVAAPGFRTTVSRQDAPDSVRVSVAEAGVLQGFPADHPWAGAESSQYLQAGNAVPVPLAEAVLRAATGGDSGGALW